MATDTAQAETGELLDLRSHLAAAEARLAAAGVSSPRQDAIELAAHVLRIERGKVGLARGFDARQAERYAEVVARRAAREPLQHVTGVAGFRRLELAVGPGVFVPRPETEVLVEWCLQALRHCDRPLVADLCAGSGAIALSIVDEHAGARVHAVEREPLAYSWLRRNVAGEERVRLHLADAADALHGLDGLFDLVVSNPPYVGDDERDRVDPEVRDHDPGSALWAGGEGLDVLRVVERTGRRLLRPGGVLAAEHSDGQGDTAPALFPADHWTDVADHRDLTGRPRFVTAVRRVEAAV